MMRSHCDRVRIGWFSGRGLRAIRSVRRIVKAQGNSHRYLHREVDPKDLQRCKWNAAECDKDSRAEERGDKSNQCCHLEANEWDRLS